MLILGRFVLNSCWWYQPIRQNDVNHSNKIFEYIETHRDATTDASRFPKRGSHLVVELTRETRMFNCFRRFSGVCHNSSSPELHAWWKPTPCLKNRLPDKDKVPSIGIIYWITAGPLGVPCLIWGSKKSLKIPNSTMFQRGWFNHQADSFSLDSLVWGTNLIFKDVLGLSWGCWFSKIWGEAKKPPHPLGRSSGALPGFRKISH